MIVRVLAFIALIGWSPLEGEQSLVLKSGDMRPDEGYAYWTPLPPSWEPSASTSEAPMKSCLILFEDGVPLPMPNALHRVIRGEGNGSYSHWGKSLIFSSSDNSDPRTNGRSYVAILSDELFSDAFLQSGPAIVADAIALTETLEAPIWKIPASEGAVLEARAMFVAEHSRNDVLFQFEIDTSPEFDSANLLRWPRLGDGPNGPNPLTILDPDYVGSNEWRVPYRLTAPPSPGVVTGDSLARFSRLLVGGLNPGWEQISELFEWVSNQLHPFDSLSGCFPPEVTLARDMGACGSLSGALSALLDAVGYDTRIVLLHVPRIRVLGDPVITGGHAAVEVFWGDQWHYLDPYFGLALEGTSVEDIASGILPREAAEPLFIYAPVGVLADKSDEFRTVRLSDYAAERLYQHDLYSRGTSHADFYDPLPARGEVAVGEAPGEPVELFGRVRVVKAGLENVRRLFPGSLAESPRNAIEVSPWSTISFRAVTHATESN